MRQSIRFLGFALLLLAACARQQNVPQDGDYTANTQADSPEAQSQFAIKDSSKIVTHLNGLKIYTVRKGPGDFPKAGEHIRLNYRGLLADGTIFDSSFGRSEPYRFTLGQTKVIKGLADGVQRMRYGGQAVLIIPPKLGYGEKNTPPNIPPNSTLVFHVDLLGSF